MTLAAAAALVPRVAAVRWLGAVGAPLGAAERTAAAAYLAGLGYADTPVAGVADWTRAKALADAPDWDPGWWQAEEALRQALLAAGTARDGSGAVLAALTGVTQAVSDRAYEDATSATRRAGIADAALARAAAGAATQAPTWRRSPRLPTLRQATRSSRSCACSRPGGGRSASSPALSTSSDPSRPAKTALSDRLTMWLRDPV